MTQHWTKEERARLKEIISRGLSSGLGSEEMTCIEGAISLARTGKLGDQPPCVAAPDRAFAIRLNDSNWSSPMIRAEALMPIAFLQPGTEGTDRQQWVERVVVGIVNRVLPMALTLMGLTAEAEACRQAVTLEAAYTAADAAYTAAYAADAAYTAAYATGAAYTATRKAASYAASYAAYTATRKAAQAADAAYTAAQAARTAASAADAADAADAAAGAAAYAASYAAYTAYTAADAVLKEAAQVAVDAYKAEGRSLDEEFVCEISTST